MTPTPPTEKVLLKYPDGRTEEHETETLTFKETTDKGWESRYKDLFLEIYRPAGMGDESDIDPRLLAFIQHIAKEEYERGQQNPKVGFLRQYLNESPEWRGKKWLNEDITRFLRIPFTNQPS